MLTLECFSPSSSPPPPPLHRLSLPAPGRTPFARPSSCPSQRHALEGAPDPFPSLSSAPEPTPSSSGLGANGSSSRSRQLTADELNTSSESAFPSLAPSAAPPARAAPAWGSSSSAKVRSAPAPPKPTTVTESLSLVVGTQTDRDGKVVPLGTTMRLIMDATKTTIEASKQMKTGVTTFFVKGPTHKQTTEAGRLLVQRLSKTVVLKLAAPVSALGTLIGPKGATLKALTSSTGCRIDIPKRDASSPAPTPLPPSASDDSDDEDEKDEETVEITISGAEQSALEAQAHLQALIGHRTSTTSTKIKTIPASFYPYVAARKAALEQPTAGLGKAAVKVNVPPSRLIKAFERMAEAMEKGEEAVDDAAATKDKDMAIIVQGEREAVGQVVQQILALYEELVRPPSCLPACAAFSHLADLTSSPRARCPRRNRRRRRSASRSPSASTASSSAPTPTRSSRRTAASLSCRPSRTRLTRSSSAGPSRRSASP